MSLNSTSLAGSQYIRLSDTARTYGSENALPLLCIESPYCQATVLLQGAQLLSFQPTGQTPWLWLSPYARFESGQSPRGGVPVCLPWFGVNRHDPGKPKHGFARNRDWQLARWQESPEAVVLEFQFSYGADDPVLFASPFSASLVITLSRSLEMTLTILNQATSTTEFSWALHSYFAVQDCTQVQIAGLEGVSGLDNLRGLQTFTLDHPIQFDQAVDSIFNHTHRPQRLQAEHALLIEGDRCPSCIVWNPGEAAAAGMADVREAYRQYVCVERGCAFDDSLLLQPGEQFTANMRITRA